MNKEVIVIGAGLAGLTAAFAACREGASVLVLDRGPIATGTNSCLANGVFSGPSEKNPPEDYVQDTLRSGCGLGREWMARQVAREAPAAFRFLQEAGVPMKERGKQRSVASPDPSIIPGVTLMKALKKRVAELEGVRFLPGVYATGFLRSDSGRVCGVCGFDRGGRALAFEGSAVVLATGGAGAVYRRHDNQKRILGQGLALAARAGLDLWDMEFVQFYPLVLADPQLPTLIVYPPFPKEARIVDGESRDILARHGLTDVNDAVVKKRDSFSALLHQEAAKGPVLLDLRAVPAPAWEVHPLAIFRRLSFDFRSKPVAIAPSVHFFMGGIRVDDSGKTDLEGLYACGEIQWGLHGANRMGGNAMTECVVSGTIAGRSAAQCEGPAGPAVPVPKASGASGQASPEARDALDALRDIAWECAGIVRSEKGIRDGLDRIHRLGDRIQAMSAKNPEERMLVEDLRSGILVVKGILTASLGRKESRGSFMRTEFPALDGNWQRNSRLTLDPKTEQFRVEYVAAGDNRG